MKTDQFQEKKRVKPQDLKKKIAELPSLYSDSIVQISTNVRGAKDALALIYVSLYFEYWSTDKIIDAIRQKCYFQNYEGEWAIVQDFLELKLQTPEQFEKYYILTKGAFDFYGNFIKRAYKMTKILKIQDVTKPSKHRVRKPVYRRGYKDKGSLRLPHENHGEKPISLIERIDRRQNVTHPLLGKNLADEDDAYITHPERNDY